MWFRFLDKLFEILTILTLAGFCFFTGGIFAYDAGMQDGKTFERERQARFCHVEEK